MSPELKAILMPNLSLGADALRSAAGKQHNSCLTCFQGVYTLPLLANEPNQCLGGMRWEDGRRSENVEDRRGMPAARTAGGGIGTLLLVLVALYFGIDPSIVVNQPHCRRRSRLPSLSRIPLRPRRSAWRNSYPWCWPIRRTPGMSSSAAWARKYQQPTLVLFSGAVESACGMASAAVGPFYCPLDQKVYIDLSFYSDLKNRFGAPGDFAQAYVIAHEVGHHVQNLLGIAEKVNSLRSRASEASSTWLSVMMELQADCLAGVWAHHADRARQILEKPGTSKKPSMPRAWIGDDRMQRRSRGYGGAGFPRTAAPPPARALVQARAGERQHRTVQHLSGRPAVNERGLHFGKTDGA